MRHIRLATRGSALALVQAHQVKASLEALGTREHPIVVDIVEVVTHGDQDRIHSLVSIGGKGLFVRRIEEVLLEHEADIAVHSAKDLPYRLAKGLTIAAVPQAADRRDLLIVPKDRPLVMAHPVIGTGSPRRICQMKKWLPQADFAENRGNITTRLRKLQEGQFDGIILAKAGVDRLQMDLSDYEVRAFAADEFIPAPCQGILAVECRQEDEELLSLLENINDAQTRKRFEIERCLFRKMQADCSVAIGVSADIADDNLTLHAMLNGTACKMQGAVEDYEELCERMAERLNQKNKGFVSLVGAGCGKDLITLQGCRAIADADVILYDDLMDAEVLKLAPKYAERLYVGKRSGQHSMKQEEINALLIQKAKEGGHIVRLKGGDSFVFGRGGEEALALSAEGIGYEVICGISSAIAVPEKLGIPVTHRGTARSFTVVTGHTAGGVGEDFEALAKLSGTLVFLMGLSNAAHIAAELMHFGKSGDTPCAILSNGYRRDEMRIDCTLATLGEAAKSAETPAIIVIGAVAAYHLQGQASQSKIVIMTGSPSFLKKEEDIFQRAGVKTFSYPSLEIVPHAENIPESFDNWDYLVFTSANGIRIFFEELRKRKTDVRSLARMKIAVIGQGCADALLQYGLCADFIPSEFVSDVFGRELAKQVETKKRPQRLLLLRAKEGAAALTDALLKHGISYDDIAVYETKACEAVQDLPQADYITFASASGVAAFFKHHDLPKSCKPIVIGPSTAAAFESCCTRAYLMPQEHTAKGMLRVILADDEAK